MFKNSAQETEYISELNPNLVRKKMCRSCPYRDSDRLPLTNELIRDTIRQGDQPCQNERIKGQSEIYVCRGSRNVQLKFYYAVGVLSKPTDACFEKDFERLKQLNDE